MRPARRVASSTARCSTCVMPDGTHTSTRARWRRLTPERSKIRRISRWVISKSVIAPPRRGRTATMWPGVRPIMCQAWFPMASTSWVRLFRRDDGGLEEDDPPPARVDERVGGPEVDGEVEGHG